MQFVGRDADLHQLHTQLQQTDRLAITAIAGMGGIGKTELALQYALQYQADYPGGVCWFLAREQELGTQIVTYARALLPLEIPDGLDLAAQVAYCWRNWRDGNVLVILDDVTDYGKIDPYLPPSDPRFRVLFTTRLQLGRSMRSFEIELLSEPAALDLLRSLVGTERINQQLSAAKALAEWLGYLPLGLELVGRYLASKPDLSLVQMQQRLQAKRLAATALAQVEPGMTAQLGVAAAIALSWQELDPAAQELAGLLSLFALAPIPWALVESCYPDRDPEELEDLRDRQLCRFSLLERMGEQTYQLHQLIREFLHDRVEELATSDALKSAFCQSMVAIAQAIPDRPTLMQIANVTSAIPHLAIVATTWQNWLQDEALAWPCTGLGRFYEEQGIYDQALPWYEQCLAVVCDRLGKNHPDVATNLNNLAGLYESQGRYQEAEPLYVQALALRRQVLGEDHPTVAISLNNLAALYYAQGRYEEAEPLYVQALALRRQALGEDHPDVASSLNNLALLYYAQGRYEEAEPLYVQALALRQQALGEDHPDVASSLNNLALLYYAQGRYEEAEPLYVQALALRRQVLGESHPGVANSLNNLAGLYASLGRYEEAEPLYVQALALRQQVLGEQHPDVAISLNNLAELYRFQGRYEEAEPLYVQALALRQQVLGELHPDVAISLNNLAELYRSQGRYGEAEPLHVQALALRRQVLGELHPDVASSLNNLAVLYYSQGRYEEAEPLYVQALALKQQGLGEDHPDVATSLHNLAGLYESQERYEEAEPLYLQALALKSQALGEDHPDVATSLNNLAGLYYVQGRYQKAESLYIPALMILLDRLGSNHPNTQTIGSNFIGLLKTVIEEGRVAELSNHPLTQSLLQQIQTTPDPPTAPQS